MQTITYLQDSLNKKRISRWSNSAMPLPVYISPYKWYKSKGEHESYKYKNMVIQALKDWQTMSQNTVSFVVTDELYNSMINLDWKRVDRKSLGCCYFNYTKENALYSAEIQIGLSDGIIHKKYMDDNEVYHTIVHEIGHALGLGHSKSENDIMYVPHKYGVTKIGLGDIQTLLWLYQFDIGQSEAEILAKYPKLNAKNLDDLIFKLSNSKSEFEQTIDTIENNYVSRDLLKESENIGELKKYLLQLNNLNLNFKDIKKK